MAESGTDLLPVDTDTIYFSCTAICPEGNSRTHIAVSPLSPINRRARYGKPAPSQQESGKFAKGNEILILDFGFKSNVLQA